GMGLQKGPPPFPPSQLVLRKARPFRRCKLGRTVRSSPPSRLLARKQIQRTAPFLAASWDAGSKARPPFRLLPSSSFCKKRRLRPEERRELSARSADYGPRSAVSFPRPASANRSMLHATAQWTATPP